MFSSRRVSHAPVTQRRRGHGKRPAPARLTPPRSCGPPHMARLPGPARPWRSCAVALAPLRRRRRSHHAARHGDRRAGGPVVQNDRRPGPGTGSAGRERRRGSRPPGRARRAGPAGLPSRGGSQELHCDRAGPAGTLLRLAVHWGVEGDFAAMAAGEHSGWHAMSSSDDHVRRGRRAESRELRKP
jgi:hypothetical protein